MNQSIRFRGLSLAKDEQAVQNGELSLCANVELHDAALRPSVLSGTKLSTPLTAPNKDWDETAATDARSVIDLIYVHKTASYTHLLGYIETDNGEPYYLYWYQEDGTFGGLVKTLSFMPTAIDSVGNTLVIVSEAGIEYALWKNTDKQYKWLGDKPPYLDIRFGLGANNFGNYETGGVDIEGSAEGFSEAWQMTNYSCNDSINRISKYSQFEYGERQVNFKEAAQSDFTQNIWALINRTNDLIAKDGHFYANFFVRYCYRLYDGSMVMHSAPVFMPVLVPDNYVVVISNLATDPGTSTNVWTDDTGTSNHDWRVYWNDKLKIRRKDSKGNDCTFAISKVTFQYMPRNVALQYLVRSSYYDISLLKDWSDIVKSVDIFVSAPITAVDETKMVKSASRYSDDYTVSKGTSLRWKPDWCLNGDVNYPVETIVDIPSLSHDAYADKIRNTSAFFKIASIKTDDINHTSEYADLKVDKMKVYNVSAQEQMKDDYKTHNFLFPKGLYVYNHRINVYGLYEQLFHGFKPSQMFFYNARLNCSEKEKNDVFTIKSVYVRLNTDEGIKYVMVDGLTSEEVQPYVLFNLPVFYPDARADKMYFIGSRTGSDESFTNKCAEIDLTSCDELNGSMHVRGFTSSYTFVDAPTINVDDIVQMPNRIYTSEQNNPYYFPVEAINTVGTGDIIGLAATTRALSQGQFGQYPLMAFTTDGIWALNVSSSGTYSTIHPISREVCVNAASICQLDQSVVFATNRALNKVAESSVASFSDILDGPFFNIASALKELYDYFNSGSHADHDIMELLSFSTPPIEYFQQGMVINDFVNNRLIVMPASSEQSQEVALVYSIRDSAWSTMLIDTPRKVINSYPYPYLQQTDGSVLVLDKKYDYTDSTLYNGLLVTRTLSFDGVMQCISAFDQQTDAASLQLLFFFGSNDNRTWHYIGRSNRPHSSYLPGHSFRFFRLAVYTKMSCAEKYFQTNLSITQKYQKL